MQLVQLALSPCHGRKVRLQALQMYQMFDRTCNAIAVVLECYPALLDGQKQQLQPLKLLLVQQQQ